jgi:hypothetical protein
MVDPEEFSELAEPALPDRVAARGLCETTGPDDDEVRAQAFEGEAATRSPPRPRLPRLLSPPRP